MLRLESPEVIELRNKKSIKYSQRFRSNLSIETKAEVKEGDLYWIKKKKSKKPKLSLMERILLHLLSGLI